MHYAIVYVQRMTILCSYKKNIYSYITVSLQVLGSS
jgi:hypothetical protein